MSLLREIQDAAIDEKIDISVVLRKCKVLAARLGNAEFKKWVDQELNGYKDQDVLPEYRVFEVFSKGHFVGPFGSELRNGDIPISCLPEKWRDNFRYTRAREPISSYSSLLKVSETQDGSAMAQWPPELVAYVGRKIYRGMNCISAWQNIPKNAIASLVDSVRNRILNFVLEIESQNPNAGEAPIDSSPIQQEKVTQIFNTHISGNVHNLASGSTDVSQYVQISVVKNDLDSLLSYLRAYEIEESDLNKLQTAILSDEDEDSTDSAWGTNVTSWLSKMIKKASKGALNIGSSVVVSVLTKAINSYYGLG